MKKLYFKNIYLFFAVATFFVYALSGKVFSQEDVSGAGSGDSSKETMNVTLDFKDADINTVLSGLSKSYNLNVIAGKDIQGKVTVNFQDVPLEEALSAILDVNGYKFSRKGRIIYIMNKSQDISTDLLTLKYAAAVDAKDMFSPMLSEKGVIKIDPVNNALIITDTLDKIAGIKDFAAKIDSAPVQVMIEAKLIDITKKDLENLGVTWTGTYQDDILFKSRPAGYDGGSGKDQYITPKVTMPGPSSSLSGGQFTLATLLSGGRTISATIDALVQSNKARILATPSVVTLNNQEARIIIGEKVPYKEKTQTTTGTTETTKYIDAGTTLRVTPQVNDNKTITMVIHPEVSSVTALLDAGPRITTREADVKVMVKNNETIVIGGLLKEEETIIKNKIPIVGDIPLLGLLFSSKSVDKEQKELVVFITPKILSPTEEVKVQEGDNKILVDDIARTLFVDKLFTRADSLVNNTDLASSEKTKNTRLREAVFLYDQILNVYPDSARADEALYKAAKINKALLENDKYEAKLSMLVEKYPKSIYAPKALSQLMVIDAQRQKEREKKILLEKEEQARIDKENEKIKAAAEAKQKAQLEQAEKAKQTEAIKEQKRLEAAQKQAEADRLKQEKAKQAELDKEAKAKAAVETKEKAAAEKAKIAEQKKIEAEGWKKHNEAIKEQKRLEAAQKQAEADKAAAEKAKQAELDKEAKAKAAAEAKQKAQLEQAEKAKQTEAIKEQKRLEAASLKEKQRQEAETLRLQKKAEADKAAAEKAKQAELDKEAKAKAALEKAKLSEEEKIKKAKEERLRKLKEAEDKRLKRLEEIENKKEAARLKKEAALLAKRKAQEDAALKKAEELIKKEEVLEVVE